jgi:hypothetical protein
LWTVQILNKDNSDAYIKKDVLKVIQLIALKIECNLYRHPSQGKATCFKRRRENVKVVIILIGACSINQLEITVNYSNAFLLLTI